MHVERKPMSSNGTGAIAGLAEAAHRNRPVGGHRGASEEVLYGLPRRTAARVYHWPLSRNEPTGSRFAALLACGSAKKSPTSKRVSRSRICSSCLASSTPCLRRALCGRLHSFAVGCVGGIRAFKLQR